MNFIIFECGHKRLLVSDLSDCLLQQYQYNVSKTKMLCPSCFIQGGKLKCL